MAVKTIGETNGIWAVLLKITLSLMPVALAWGAWITTQQVLDTQFRGQGERFTPDDFILRVEPRLAKIEFQLSTFEIPPAWFQRMVEENTSAINDLKVEIGMLRQQIKDHDLNHRKE